ncbi:MAG: hypothetical protein HQL23_09580, partial [Candidatus Omnitrophica bacterium]|nr:hypothetical protein [Candidatus Omnitrophota bacterium]
ITHHFAKLRGLDPYFLFFAGFFATQHVVLTAQNLYDQDNKPFKPTYIPVIAACFIIVVALVILFFDLIAGHLTFMNFCDTVWKSTSRIYIQGLRIITK